MKVKNIEVKVFDDKKNLYKELTKDYLSYVNSFQNKDLTLGFATGSSPLPLYQELVEEYKKGNISFKQVKTFNLDEYVGLSKENKESYAFFMFSNLFDKVDVLNKNVNFIQGDALNLKNEIKRYNKLLKRNRINLQLLGIGANGHIAFNEPGNDFFRGAYVVDLDEKTIEANSRFFNNDSSLVPQKAVTMSIKQILKAEKIFLIATGENKKTAITQLLYGKITKFLPASFLQKHKDVTLYLDKEAAANFR